jgi:LAS superfamily LD-carboxypeptidase LdcB
MVDYGYRDFAGQVEMWDSYCSNKHEDSCPVSGCTPRDTTIAACPGTSIHQTGRAIDFKFGLKNGGEYLRWLNDNANKYGFEETVSGEPWHWEYTAKLLDGETPECEGD